MRDHYESMRKAAVDREVREMGVRYVTEKSTLENQLKNMEQRVMDLENNCALLSTENERLNIKNNEKMQELELLKAKLMSLE